jgi:hypothetical protein
MENIFFYVDLQARAHCDALTGQVTAGPKVPTQFCPVCPQATINTSVKLENPRVLRK